MRLAGSRVIMPRFGSSDCRCASHLAFFQKLPIQELL
jgi:Uri superfamily endonuclease